VSARQFRLNGNASYGASLAAIAYGFDQTFVGRCHERFTGSGSALAGHVGQKMATIRSTYAVEQHLMECAYKSCTIHVSAGIENGEIVGNARIELPPGPEAGVPETHDMIFAQGFVDEHEAIEFASACAKAWVDEHCEEPPSS